MHTVADTNGSSTTDTPLFADPVAKQTSWDPLPGPQFDFLGKTMHVVSADRIVYRLDPIRCGLLIAVALACVFVFGYATVQAVVVWLNGGDITVRTVWLPLLPSGAGLIAVVMAGARHTQPIVLDKERGTLEHPYAMPGTGPMSVRLFRIHALQLLSYSHRNGGASSKGLQLIVVLESGERLLLAGYGSSETVREDADSLGRWLGVPVWDSITHEL